jgi:hypothetical protein
MEMKEGEKKRWYFIPMAKLRETFIGKTAKLLTDIKKINYDRPLLSDT